MFSTIRVRSIPGESTEGFMSRLEQRLIGAAILSALVGSVASAQSRTVLLLEEEVIKGEVQKPTVTLFVSRQNINTDATLELRESFVPVSYTHLTLPTICSV